MSKEVLPCMNCITYPVCQYRYNECKNRKGKLFSNDIYGGSIDILEKKCTIITEWLYYLVGRLKYDKICVRKTFNLEELEDCISYTTLVRECYKISDLELMLITYFDNNENSFRILEGNELKLYFRLKEKLHFWIKD